MDLKVIFSKVEELGPRPNHLQSAEAGINYDCNLAEIILESVFDLYRNDDSLELLLTTLDNVRTGINAWTPKNTPEGLYQRVLNVHAQITSLRDLIEKKLHERKRRQDQTLRAKLHDWRNSVK